MNHKNFQPNIILTFLVMMSILNFLKKMTIKIILRTHKKIIQINNRLVNKQKRKY